MVILQQMAILVIMILIGFFIKKKDKMSEQTAEQLAWFVINVANPAMILSSSMSQEIIENKNLLMALFTAIGVYCYLIIIAAILPHFLSIEKNNYGIYRAMTVFSNIGFMGFPLIAVSFGSKALLYASFFIIIYNVLIYTYGVKMLVGQQKRGGKGLVKNVFNIGSVFCLISLVISVCHMYIPEVIQSLCTMVGQITAPISMILIGVSLEQISFKELLNDKKMLIYLAVRQICIPIVSMFVVQQIIEDDLLRGVCLIVFTTPIGSMVFMLAQQYNIKKEQVAKMVAVSSLLSVVTIPVLAMIFL